MTGRSHSQNTVTDREYFKKSYSLHCKNDCNATHRRELVLVYELRPADGLRDCDEEVVGVPVHGAEGLQEDVAVGRHPQGAGGVVGA